MIGDAGAHALLLQELDQLARALGPMVPDFDEIDRALARMRAHQERGERAGADDQQLARVRRREIARGERRGGGGAP